VIYGLSGEKIHFRVNNVWRLQLICGKKCVTKQGRAIFSPSASSPDAFTIGAKLILDVAPPRLPPITPIVTASNESALTRRKNICSAISYISLQIQLSEVGLL